MGFSQAGTDLYLEQFNYQCYIYIAATADEISLVWRAKLYTALLNTAFMILGLHSWPSWQSERYSPLFYTFIFNEPILVTFPRLTCGLHTQGRLIQGARGSSLLFDLVVLIITWTKLRVAAMDIRSQARVSVVLIRDTTFYFSLQLIVNILGISIGSVTVFLVPISTWIAVLTSSLLSRLLFDLRKVAAEGLGVSLTHSMTLAFADPDLFEDDVTSDRHLDAEAI
ncbi:predicted protein [Postia placenta Mad-698-R]|nr:predicted protein [Postia placenta Mad-698-R]